MGILMSFTEDYNKTIIGLSSLNPGESVELNKTKIGKQDKELMIEVCKVFIDNNPDFELSNDYKYIQRINKF